MSDPLYRKDLLRLAADAHGAGRLHGPHATGIAFNPACGDRVTVDLNFSNGRIERFSHETRACVLAQASASILGLTITGVRAAELEELRAAIREMLESHAAAPSAPFQSYSVFEGAVEFTSRHRCVLLPLEAVLNALKTRNPDRERF